jgi:hypothetical protein
VAVLVIAVIVIVVIVRRRRAGASDELKDELDDGTATETNPVFHGEDDGHDYQNPLTAVGAPPETTTWTEGHD